MASFLSGLMSVGKKLGSAAKDWGQGTKVAQDFSSARQSKINPWYKAKNQPGSKGISDTSSKPSMPGSQDA